MAKIRKTSLYHYCLSLESALCELYGMRSRWQGCAGAFQDPKFVRLALLSGVKRIRRRLDEVVTMDDRLALIIDNSLEAIERESRKLNKRGDNLIDIVGKLIHLVANLIGYDWLEGKPNRQIHYFQTMDQVRHDDRNMHPQDYSGSTIFAHAQKRGQVVVSLHREGFRVPQIANIMNLSKSRVKDILVRAGEIARIANVRYTNPG